MNVTAATDKNFWEVDGYKQTLKRLSNGAVLCSKYLKMVKQRAEIEAEYAKRLRDWADSWENSIAKSSEYGTLEAAWHSQVKEARDIARCHDDCNRNICEEVIPFMNSWKHDNYHRAKSIVYWKEVNRAEKNFSTAHKPWKNRLQKVNKAKKAYHKAVKAYNLQKRRVESADNDVDFNEVRSAAWLERAEKKKSECNVAVHNTKSVYENHLDELSQYKNEYIEGMQDEFCQCQEAERKRMLSFTQAILKYKAAVDLSTDTRIPSIYQDFSDTISQVNVIYDLQYYSESCGAGMRYSWPGFEEYNPSRLRFQAAQSLDSSDDSFDSITSPLIRPAPTAPTVPTAPVIPTVPVGNVSASNDLALYEPPPPSYTTALQDNLMN